MLFYKRLTIRRSKSAQMSCFLGEVGFNSPKETILERADSALQLLMFVTAEKEGQMFIIFFLPIICQLLSPRF